MRRERSWFPVTLMPSFRSANFIGRHQAKGRMGKRKGRQIIRDRCLM